MNQSMVALMSPDAVTQQESQWALFLDVDGTLLEVAETPQRVRVPDGIKQLLLALTVRFDGAVALISGRSLDDVDRLFAPMRFCVAGIWGLEYRESSGCVSRPSLHTDRLSAAREAMQVLVQQHEGLYLEDKGCGLAVHYRRAPHLEESVRRAMSGACRDLGSDFAMEDGGCYVEVRPSMCSTAAAISLFMQQTPFARRIPIFIGDDLSDEAGFHAVNALGGVSIRIGAAANTVAHHCVADTDQLIHWLAILAAQQLPMAGTKH